MSREFGSYQTGYFHTQIETAANDALAGRAKITRLWGKFLEEFKHVAYSIATSEANNSAEDDPIMESIKRMPALQNRLVAIMAYLEPFERVAEEAVREQCAKAGKKK